MNQGNSSKGQTEKNQFLHDFILIQDIYRHGQITFEVIILSITSTIERKTQSHKGTVNCIENHSPNSIPAQLTWWFPSQLATPVLQSHCTLYHN